MPVGYSNAPRNRLADDQGNLIDGGAGDDFIAAGTGADYVHGGAGRDFIFGMDKDDILFGGDDNDRIYGDADSDSVPLSERGNDVLDGGAGADTSSRRCRDGDARHPAANQANWRVAA